MAVILIGQNGQVAREVQKQAALCGVSLIVLGREALDLEKTELARRTLRKLAAGAEAIVNTSAYTAVDRAEKEPDRAQVLNTVAPGMIAEVGVAAQVPVIHLSTDYVFDGAGTAPHRPEDTTRPLGVYGRTKRDGEMAIRACDGQHVILRTSWVFSEHGSNFVKTMLRLGAQRDRLPVVDDQVGGPTAAADIAEALFAILPVVTGDKTVRGTFHLSGSPEVSWAEFAREIMDRASLRCRIEPIASADYPTAAQRPLNSRLDCRSTERVFGVGRPDWHESLGEVLAGLGALPGQGAITIP